MLSSTQKQSIIELDAQGLTAGQIARSLIGVSRSAVCGYLHRHRAEFETPEQQEARKAKKKARQKLVVKDRCASIKSKPLPKMESLGNEPDPVGPEGDFPPRATCRYTKDDVATPNWRMCGHPESKQHPSWCDWHYHNRIRSRSGKAGEL